MPSALKSIKLRVNPLYLLAIILSSFIAFIAAVLDGSAYQFGEYNDKYPNDEMIHFFFVLIYLAYAYKPVTLCFQNSFMNYQLIHRKWQSEILYCMLLSTITFVAPISLTFLDSIYATNIISLLLSIILMFVLHWLYYLLIHTILLLTYQQTGSYLLALSPVVVLQLALYFMSFNLPYFPRVRHIILSQPNLLDEIADTRVIQFLYILFITVFVFGSIRFMCHQILEPRRNILGTND